MNDKTTYIAREDFLRPIPRINGDGPFVDGSYIGQLGMDETDTLYVWGGDIDNWIDMTAIVANFSYVTEGEIIGAFKDLKVPEPNDVEPLTWSNYDIDEIVCKDEFCDKLPTNCGIEQHPDE